MDSSEILSKKLIQNERDEVYLCITLNSPFHNLKNRKFKVNVTGTNSQVQLRLLYSFTCLCEPSSVLSTRNSCLTGGGNLTDLYIDPSTRIVTIQTSITPKEVNLCGDGNTLDIKLGTYGKNPGRSQIKFLALVFEIKYGDDYYQAYITMKTQRGLGEQERGCTNKESCFISNAVQDQLDEFIQGYLRFMRGLGDCLTPTNRKKTPKKQKLAAVIVEHKFVEYLEEKSDYLDTHNSSIINFTTPNDDDELMDDANPQMDLFSKITYTKIQFESGPKEGGQPNTLYLSFKDSSQTGLFDILKLHPLQSMSMCFVPKDHPEEVLIAPPQLLHIGEIGNYAALHFITSPVFTPFEGDLETFVFLVINDEMIDGHVEYTFTDTSKTAKSSNTQSIHYESPEYNGQSMRDGQSNNQQTQQGSSSQTTYTQHFQFNNFAVNYTPVVTILNIGQFAKQQYQQSKDTFDNIGDFVGNFQLQFGKIIDVLGYNFAGFLKSNGFVVEGIQFEEVICPDSSSEKLVTIKPAEVRKEEKLFSAEEATDMIVKSIKNRIPLEDEKMIENSVQTLAHKKTSDLDSKQAEDYIVINTVVPKHLEANYNPGKRHARNDKVPYLNLKFVIYDANALPSQDAHNHTPKLKVALFFAKFVISFDEKTHMIVIEDQEKKENFLYQTFYDCNIYTVRKNEEIDNFLTRLAEFNCAWNCSQFYDEKNSNTAHYVISVLKYLNIWDPNALWAKFAVNVCENKPLEKHVTIYPDFFHMDSKNSIPAMLSGAKAAACPKLKETLTAYMKQLSDAPFKYHFSGYSDDPEVEAKAARTELEFMCELLRECGESYLRNMEDGVRAQRLLKKIMQTNYGQSLSRETWENLKQLSDKHNTTFHKQMYNFTNFFNALIKSTQKSEIVEKVAKEAWANIQNNEFMQMTE